MAKVIKASDSGVVWSSRSLEALEKTGESKRRPALNFVASLQLCIPAGLKWCP